MTSGPRYLVSLLAVIAMVGGPLAIAGSSSKPLEAPDATGLTGAELAAQLPRIANRVEQLRDLRFDHLPKVKVISEKSFSKRVEAAQAKDQKQLSALESVLKTLGLIEADVDLAKVGKGYAQQIAGYYSPKKDTFFILQGNRAIDPAEAAIIAAHEIDHALDDQRFGLRGTGDLSDDRATAELSLTEGVATVVEDKYAQRFLDPAELLRLAATIAPEASAAAAQLPQALQASLEFPYIRGRLFVSALRRLGSGWNLVNIALRNHPPLSSEQIIHPRKYLAYEKPVTVRLAVDPKLPGAWRHLTGGVLGELDTYQLLRGAIGDEAALRVAAGWGGQRTQLWRRGSAACEAPCRSRDALVATWAWDSGRDAAEFETALRTYLRTGLGASDSRLGLFSLEGASIALSSHQREVTLAFAPRPGLARRLATGD